MLGYQWQLLVRQKQPQSKPRDQVIGLGSAVLPTLAVSGYPTDSLKLVPHLESTKHNHAEDQTKTNFF